MIGTMNILEQEDIIKGLPDNLLQTEAQRPTGKYPPFLVVSEIQRRTDMRKRFDAAQQQPQQPIAQQIVAQGIGSMQPQQTNMMASGGKTGYFNGGGIFDEGVDYLKRMGSRIVGANLPTARDVTFFDPNMEEFRQLPPEVVNKIKDDYPQLAQLSLSDIAATLTPQQLSYYENKDYVIQQGSGEEKVERMMPDGTLQEVVPETEQRPVLGFDLPQESMVPVEQARFGLGASPGGISFAANLSDVARENPLQTGIGLLSSFIPGLAGTRGAATQAGRSMATRTGVAKTPVSSGKQLVATGIKSGEQRAGPQLPGLTFYGRPGQNLVPKGNPSNVVSTSGNTASQLGIAGGIAGIGGLVADATRDDPLFGEEKGVFRVGSDVQAIDETFVDDGSRGNVTREELIAFTNPKVTNVTQTDGTPKGAIVEDGTKDDPTKDAFDLLGERLAASEANLEGYDKTTMGLILAQLGTGIMRGDIASGIQGAAKIAAADKEKREDRAYASREKALDRALQKQYYDLRRQEFTDKQLTTNLRELTKQVNADPRVKQLTGTQAGSLTDPDYIQKLNALKLQVARELVSQSPAAYGGPKILDQFMAGSGGPSGQIVATFDSKDGLKFN
jgi:hypothetical protein